MKKLLLSFVLIVAFALSCSSALANGHVYYTEKNGVFTLTEANYDKAVEIVASGDREAFSKMLANKQIYLFNKNIQVYVVERTFLKAKVRKKGSTLEVWTSVQSINTKPY